MVFLKFIIRPVACLLLYCAICISYSFGATVSGKITDENNDALPFASVYISGTTKGVSSNKDGIYSIELPAGKHELTFKYIGYKIHTETVNIADAVQKISLDVKMEPQSYQIREMTVSANAEDPAYEVIRHAIKKRKKYLNEVKEFSCDIYIKGTQRMTEFPKKFMGFDVNAEGNIDNKTGIFYLSESVEKYYFRQPDKVKEEMISSKVSGNSKAFSFNRASDLMLNFYQNLVELRVVSQRGFVSPISESALFYYKYHLAGTFFENGQMINKIEVIPKRENDPVFRGYIYITENSWRIHSTDLFLIKDAGIRFVDTLRINQVHLPVNDVWMLFSNKLSFSFSLFGFKGNGVYLGIHSNYNTDPQFPKNFFTAEVMKVEDDANKKDSSYWNTIRPVQLTSEEKTDYKKKDSVEVIHNSKEFKDSIDKKRNKFKPMNLLLGYSYDQSYKKRSISFSSLLKNIQFNTVQGFVLGADVDVEKRYESGKNLQTGVSASYGFSDMRINPSAKFRYEYDPKKFANIGIEGGLQRVQFNERNPISPFINSLYSLIEKENYAKLYQKTFVELSHNSELLNGLYLRTSLQYADRAPLMNTSEYTFFPDKNVNRNYTSNDPLHPLQDSANSFQRNRSLEFRTNLRIRFAQKYVTRPDEKWVYGSKYPTLNFEYRKGINNLFGSDVDYDLLKASISDRIKLGLLGRARYVISAGTFLNARKMQFMDYYHFSGNQTIFSNFAFTDFQLLNYYTNSTNHYFVEAHYEHDFGGFIFNKFPLLRKLKVNEFAGVHYLHTDVLPNYFEAFAGIEKLNLFRIDFVMGFSENQKTTTGIRLGLKIGRR
ncbi:MAG: DUF5686 and carboxypeptidase regulatory-like domain-containing protein [Bacteroidia bacterium]